MSAALFPHRPSRNDETVAWLLKRYAAFVRRRPGQTPVACANPEAPALSTAT